MTLSNKERATRCQEAIAAYSDDDIYTNLVDFLADAMHFSHQSGHSFSDAIDTAVMHFEAEMTGDDILADFNYDATNERNQTMTTQSTNHCTPWKPLFDRDGTEDFDTICDADGDAIVTSPMCKTCCLPQGEDEYVPALVHQMRLMTVAPKLLDALTNLLAQTVDADLRYGITLSEGETDAREKAVAAIAEATEGAA